jgi:hypothetical protein
MKTCGYLDTGGYYISLKYRFINRRSLGGARDTLEDNKGTVGERRQRPSGLLELNKILPILNFIRHYSKERILAHSNIRDTAVTSNLVRDDHAP